MDASKLASLMLHWERTQLKANGLKAIIEKVVLESGVSREVGNVVAKYNAGRRTFDYKTAAVSNPNVTGETILLYTKTSTSVDWRKLCKDRKIANVPFGRGKPSVSVRLK